MTGNKIKVLIIDDSALVREVLTRTLAKDRQIEVVGAVIDPIYAIKKIKELRPDVITLDLEMPRMDGLTFLEKLMSVHPMPVVVISSLAQKGSAATIKALELGAIDFVPKPAMGVGKTLDDMSYDIIAKVKNAVQVNMDELRKQAKRTRMTRKPGQEEQEPVKEEKAAEVKVSSTDKIIVIGASTGGTVAVKNILQKLPANIPGVMVVLHMPAGFTASYAQGLNNSCRMKVKEAQNGEMISTGCAYIAPGGQHMLLSRSTMGYSIKLDNGPPVNRHRPSVDRTFSSVAEKARSNVMGIILTGMGDDGARGMKELHDRGFFTVAQDEKSSIVFGMPRQAIALGGVKQVLPLDDIAGSVISYIKG